MSTAEIIEAGYKAASQYPPDINSVGQAVLQLLERGGNKKLSVEETEKACALQDVQEWLTRIFGEW